MNVTLHAVSKKFGHVVALRDVSFSVAPGEIVAVVGPNGAGKTTLLRLLATVARPDSGELRLNGEVLNRSRLDLREKLMFLPDSPFVFPQMTVLAHIGMVLRLYRKDAAGVEERVVGHLAHLDMLPLAQRRLQNLSRGQLYKATLAALLTVDPELWLLDEPLASGMDPGGLAYFKSQARTAASDRGRTILYSTQILEIAEKFADRICVVDKGKLHLYETVAALKEKLSSEDGVLETVFRRLRE